MNIDNYIQEAGAFATLAGILGGFAFSAVVQLLGSERQSKVLTATIVTFAFSSMMSFYAVIVFVLALAATAETNSIIAQVDKTGNGAMLGLLGGIYVFLLGVALAGWIRSKAAGIATSAFAIITMCMTSVALTQVLMAMPPTP
ncbi:MAG: hypothetical protein HZB50_15830 [Chloroflexi bacterium]|nr:hypothetical protein [Chloroflexota bacterium]